MQPLKMANNETWELGVLGFEGLHPSLCDKGVTDSLLQPLHRHLEHEVFG